MSASETAEHYVYLIGPIARALKRRLPDWVSEEDLVGAGHQALVSEIIKFDPGRGCSLEAFLKFRIKARMIDSIKTELGREPKRTPIPENLASRQVDPERAAIRSAEIRCATRVLSSLDPSQRQLLRLRYVDGLGRSEAAAALKLSSREASRMHRTAVERLRRCGALFRADSLQAALSELLPSVCSPSVD